MMTKKAVLYARYSSQNQREESIGRQIEKIEQFCKQNNLEIIEEYIDEGQSGTTDKRDSFQKMMEDAIYSDWDYIIVYKLDRLSRNVSDAMHYKKQLNNYGIRILSVIEDFDESTPEGGFFNLVTMGISEFYSKNLAREAFAGLMQNAKRAMHTGGSPPLGYDYDKMTLKFKVNDHEAKAVKIIFEMTLQGKSYAEIARYLNSKGYLNKFGNQFKGFFTDTLKNRKYIGEYVYNRVASKSITGTRNSQKTKSENNIVRIPNAFQAIIDNETFEKVQKLMRERIHKNKRNGPPSKYLLSGLIVCEHCGYKVSGNISYSGRNKRARIAYRCKTKKREGVCKLKDINTKYLDRFVIQEILKMLKKENAGLIKKEINSQLKALKLKLNENIEELEKMIEENDKIIKVIANKIASSSRSVDKLLTEQMQEISKENDELKIKIREQIHDKQNINNVLVKDVQAKQSYFKRQIQTKGKMRKIVIHNLVHEIIQGNREIKLIFTLNPYIPYSLNSDLLREVVIDRDKLARNNF